MLSFSIIIAKYSIIECLCHLYSTAWKYASNNLIKSKAIFVEFFNQTSTVCMIENEAAYLHKFEFGDFNLS